jgi:hypothetical protein
MPCGVIPDLAVDASPLARRHPTADGEPGMFPSADRDVEGRRSAEGLSADNAD